ncbi:BT4734/BF3469 family protein [Cytophagaceae bacterium DM2B3-1]|uniref:BT4734/BF3469 family protein n=1 Tax=Xanthocytophaga flava TaxID=3048013 RepID=A0ABT7CUE6_9BACT|nr:BT4734/BF3469 family protein [Xanthocytophaga flavus]MDJ1469069.1 BT4734/BF3469 family protein [Xanthocytophaga flavus]MDJ1497385.1 BT4734/BF3469 family protein [Xanthocytophaga flavus]
MIVTPQVGVITNLNGGKHLVGDNTNDGKIRKGRLINPIVRVRKLGAHMGAPLQFRNATNIRCGHTQTKNLFSNLLFSYILMSTISFFSPVDALTCNSYPLDLYLTHIQEGLWRGIIEQYRQERTSQLRLSLSVVTLSGSFAIRNQELSLIRHSGFIGIDVDGFRDLQRGKQILAQDKYTYAVFENYSGKGLTVVVRILANEHTQAYQALSVYYEAVYGIVTDPSDQQVTKLRYVTYDPGLTGNYKAEVFYV